MHGNTGITIGENTMRKLVAGLFLSLDGVTEAPNEWQFDHFDEGMLSAMKAHLAGEDTILLGRVTYQEWAGYWPTAKGDPYGDHINNVQKYVVSSTLKNVGWGTLGKIDLLKGNLAQEIARLKKLPGKNIGVNGSPSLVRSLVEADLLDELTLLIHPVIVGKGKRLFKDGSSLKRLALVDAKTTPTGVSIVTYRPRRENA